MQQLIGNISAWVFAKWQLLPQQIRFMLRDMVEGAIVAVGGLTLFWPQNPSDARELAMTVFVAVGGAVIAVARRYLISWLSGLFAASVPPDAAPDPAAPAAPIDPVAVNPPSEPAPANPAAVPPA